MFAEHNRRNWLFCNTPNGADASAALYFIIETAKSSPTNTSDGLQLPGLV